MSTFNELIHNIKDFCDKQYELIRKRFLEGDYETLKNYFL